MNFKIRNPDYVERVREIFGIAAFVNHLGIRLCDMGPGWCDSELDIAPHHLQQNGYVHAGAQATLADHTAGGAVGTLLSTDQTLLTVEFKINLLRPALTSKLVCHAVVLRPGKSLSIAEAEVRALLSDREPELVAKAMMTLAIIPRDKLA